MTKLHDCELLWGVLGEWEVGLAAMALRARQLAGQISPPLKAPIGQGLDASNLKRFGCHNGGQGWIESSVNRRRTFQTKSPIQ
jgi:hypothetical protein